MHAAASTKLSIHRIGRRTDALLMRESEAKGEDIFLR